jgi:hypothetical protein
MEAINNALIKKQIDSPGLIILIDLRYKMRKQYKLKDQIE